ncbi:MAG: hypothetical protein WB711_23350 [Terriglobales bacterium]
MKNYKAVLGLLSTLCLLMFAVPTMRSQDKSAQGTVQVHLVATNEAQRGDEVPALQQGDVKVKQGKNFLKVNQLIPAKGDNAALQLFILIDDTLETGVGNNFNDIRDFIKAQPATTMIAVGYMSNAAVQVAQNFTADHDLAAKALRLPRGSLSAMDSAYLSLISLVKGWPQQNVRREVLMVADGIDRLRGAQPSRPTGRAMTPRSGRAPVGSPVLGPDYGPVYHSMPTMSPDVNSASEISQRYNVIVYPLYAVGVGRAARSSWDLEIGLSGLTKIADETGGDCFSLGTSNLVSFKPYLDRLQKIFDNQYYVVFQATPGKKDGLQRVNLTTEVPNSEIAAANNVWVPIAK